jgi:acyl carrier protein
LTETDDRLIRCFFAVFPALAADGIRSASVESVEDWDSLAALRLAAVLEEEYGIQIDLADLQELSSFEAIRHYLKKRWDVS